MIPEENAATADADETGASSTQEENNTTEQDVNGEVSSTSQDVKEGAEPSTTPQHADASDRIRRLNRENNENKTLLSEKDTRIAELEAENQKKKLDAIPMPKRDDYESEQDFLVDYDKYRDAKDDVRQEERDAKAAKSAGEAQDREAWSSFDEKVSKLDSSQYPDMDLATKSKSVIYSPFSREFVRESTVGPQIVHHFYKNPDVANDIARMPAAEQAQALVDLQQNIIKSKNSNKQTNAPDPIDPVKSSEGALDIDMSKLSMPEYAKRRNEGRHY